MCGLFCLFVCYVYVKVEEDFGKKWYMEKEEEQAFRVHANVIITKEGCSNGHSVLAQTSQNPILNIHLQLGW